MHFKGLKSEVVSTVHYCNEGIFARLLETHCLQWNLVHLHMVYTSLAEFVFHKKIERLTARIRYFLCICSYFLCVDYVLAYLAGIFLIQSNVLT